MKNKDMVYCPSPVKSMVFLLFYLIYFPFQMIFLLPWQILKLAQPKATLHNYSVQSSHSVSLTLCDPMDYSMPGLPVHHQLPEFTQTHVHWVSDAIQPSQPLLSPSPPAFNLSPNQGLFKWVIRWPSIRALALASVLWMNIQGWFPLGLTGSISLQSKGLSKVFSNTTVQKRLFFSAWLSLWSNSHIHTWLLEKS